MLRFKASDLQPVIAEAIATESRLILVKDHGVYFLAEAGERTNEERRKHIAYAVGCNPDIDAFDDWWALARDEFGGDDFVEYFDRNEPMFQEILINGADLEVSATETHLTLELVATR